MYRTRSVSVSSRDTIEVDDARFMVGYMEERKTKPSEISEDSQGFYYAIVMRYPREDSNLQPSASEADDLSS